MHHKQSFFPETRAYILLSSICKYTFEGLVLETAIEAQLKMCHILKERDTTHWETELCMFVKRAVECQIESSA